MSTTPTPAEIATFARAIGWDHVSRDRRKSRSGPVSPIEWSADDIKDLCAIWILWHADIQAAFHGFASADKQTSDRVSLDTVMKQLGTQNRATVKDWFIAFRSRTYGGTDGSELAERDWGNIIVQQSMAASTVAALVRERDLRKRTRAKKAAQARHKKTVSTN